jgi:hypothetical protein
MRCGAISARRLGSCPKPVRLRPQIRGSGEGIDTGVLPPLGFISEAMELAVVSTAKRDRELVAHLAS